jgi:integrase
MISRNNWKIAKAYLDYRANVLQNDPKTIRSGWVALKHLLQWADSVEFRDAAKIRPTFPDHLLTARNDGKPEPLSPIHMAKVLAWARGLFEWVRLEHPSQYRNTPPSWIESLQVRRGYNPKSRLTRHEYWTLEDVIKVVDYPASSLRLQRDQAALAFIFASGMRGGAFVTLPLRSVDLDNMRVYQLPEWGVQTKMSKAAITHLLPIPRLIEVIKKWDTFVRSRANNIQTAWYTRLTPNGMDIVADDLVSPSIVAARRDTFFQGLRKLCDLAGVENKSPHKIRHGHGVYGIRRAKTMPEYKALSQNMMHESVVTTDKYSDFLSDEVGQIISTFKPDD